MSEELTLVSVIGCPRSGTTLMQAQIAKNFDLVPIAETHFISLFKKYGYLYKNCRTPLHRIKLLQALQEFTKIRWGVISGYNIRQISEMGVLPTLENYEAIVNSSSDYDSLINSVLMHHAVRNNSKGVIEKFSYYYPLNIDELSQILPNAKFIHVVRDGRDVCLSWCKTWFGPKTLKEATLLWQKHVRGYSEWGKHHPERYLEIDFTDILKSPEETLRTISRFLGLELINAKTSSLNLFNILGKRPHYVKSQNNPDKHNHAKWKSQMTTFEASLFWKLAGETATIKGYSPSSNYIQNSFGKQNITYFSVSLFDYITGKRRWQRRILNILPLVIWCCHSINISPFSVIEKLKNIIRKREISI